MGAPPQTPPSPADQPKSMFAGGDQDTAFKLAGINPLVKFGHEGVLPPAQAYVLRDDFVTLAIWNSLAAASVDLNVRILRADGTISDNTWTVVPTSDRALTFQTFPLEEGFILSAAVINSGAAPLRGQLFTRVALSRRTSATNFGFVSGTLIADYLTGTLSVGWPGGTLRSAPEGPGFIRTVTGTVPAAGAEIVETVPARARWRVQSIKFHLATAAGGGNRQPAIIFDDGANIYMGQSAVATLAGSSAQDYTGLPGATSVTSNQAFQSISLPSGVILPAGHRIRTSTLAIAAADQYSSIFYTVEEWIDQ